ncbi:thiol reductase thioredoxin, partial [Methanocorpusculum sp.]|nr:thiol reductase thioredoxin [Methanocorpusculum sp.]
MSKPILYDFFATWCGPCRIQSPIIHQLEERLADKIEVKMVDVDEHPDL